MYSVLCALRNVRTSLALPKVSCTSASWRCDSENCRAVKYVRPAIDADRARAPSPKVTVSLARKPRPAQSLQRPFRDPGSWRVGTCGVRSPARCRKRGERPLRPRWRCHRQSVSPTPLPTVAARARSFGSRATRNLVCDIPTGSTTSPYASPVKPRPEYRLEKTGPSGRAKP